MSAYHKLQIIFTLFYIKIADIVGLAKPHVVIPVGRLSVCGGGIGSGGCDLGGGVGGCDATSEPVMETPVPMSSCGMACCCTAIPTFRPPSWLTGRSSYCWR
jgi:hypothetical protein